MNFTYQPLVTWPGKMTENRKRAQFRASYGKTLDLLEYELAQLGANEVILQVALEPSDIRLDGRPRSGVKARHPGVVLTFESKYGPLSYPCDRFDHQDDNLRAIALSLEHLRAVDRYGVTRRGEQYKGWAALEDKTMKPKEAAVVLQNAAGGAATNPSVNSITMDRNLMKSVYNRAALATHPDRGGRQEDFSKVTAAYEVLTAMFDKAEK